MQLKFMNRQWQLATHCVCAHDMSIRPIQVEVILYLGQNRYRKPRCRIGLLQDYEKGAWHQTSRKAYVVRYSIGINPERLGVATHRFWGGNRGSPCMKYDKIL